MATILLTLMLTVLLFIGSSNAMPKTIVPAVDWYDTSGNLIEAHGGSVIKVGETYYWFGEEESDKTTALVNVGEDRSKKTTALVNVYSSTDLVTWTFKNHSLARTSIRDAGTDHVIEWPKVIYDESIQMYAMFFHIRQVISPYTEDVGMAVSSTIDGVFTYTGKINPNDLQIKEMTVFKDTDNQVYFIYSAYKSFQLFNNVTILIKTPLRISKLESYQTKQFTEVFNFTNDYYISTPAVVKVGNTYYMIASSTELMYSQDVHYATATSMSGPWSNWTPLTADTTTFTSQSSSIITVEGINTTSYIYAGDRWVHFNRINDSRYVWLPLIIDGNHMSMSWQNYWTIDTSTGVYTNEPIDTGSVYYANSSLNTLNGTAEQIRDCVGHIGKSAENYVVFNGITATTKGVHTVRVYYVSDSLNTAYISVNNGTGVALRLPAFWNFSETRLIAIEIMLEMGNNTIKIYMNSSEYYGLDICKITVSK